MAELSDLRLYYGTDKRVGSPVVARRLLAFERVADEQTRSALYLTGQTKAAAERLQTFARKHGVTLWREPRRRRAPKVAATVNHTLIARFVNDCRLREGAALTVRHLTQVGAVLLAERLEERGGRTLRLAASGAVWSLRTKAPGEEASAELALEWHGDDRHDEREELQLAASKLYEDTVASLTRTIGKPARTGSTLMTEWVFPRTMLQLRLDLSDLFARVSVCVKSRSMRGAMPRAPSGSSRRRGR
ncbi:MAG: hypothetical protein JNJ54_24385 [Myxococcaceae bacterium]|nr:hypothetical protein [Myxococcaceae bacterium]